MSKNKIKLLTLSGLLGGLIMFIGDQLFYYYKVSGADYNTIPVMGEMPIDRLIAGGVLGPVAAIFYIIGAYYLYEVFKKTNRTVALVSFGLLAVFLLIAGAYHAVFATYGFAARVPSGLNAEHVEYVSRYLAALHSIDYVIGIGCTALFLYLVIFKKSSLPPWLAFFTPTLIILIQPFFKNYIPYPLGTIIYGGWFNLSFALFFLMSFFAVGKLKE